MDIFHGRFFHCCFLRRDGLDRCGRLGLFRLGGRRLRRTCREGESQT